MKYLISLRQGLEKMLEEHHGYLIGEDIQEPYGGAFRVTKGLSEMFPEQIIGTPMSEQGFTGLGVGMALHGDFVSVEIMFGDFITLIADQMINHAAKFRDMYHQDMHLVVRFPSGGYRGYGATHSQSLEKMYMGIPGIQVIAPSIALDPGKLFLKAIASGVPTLFVENKLDYPKELLENRGRNWVRKVSSDTFPVVTISSEDEEPDLTLITYGGMVSMAMEIKENLLFEEEQNIEILILSDLSGYRRNLGEIRTDKAVVLEEGVAEFGWGSEICYELSCRGIQARRVGAQRRSIPAAKGAEEAILPSLEETVAVIEGMIR